MGYLTLKNALQSFLTRRVQDAEYERSREIKALKTLAVLQAVSRKSLSTLRVLEVGSHQGEISLRLAPHFQEYVGIDISEEHIESARAKLAAVTSPVCVPQFQKMDAEKLEFPNEAFDIVVCSHVYEHVSHPEAMMSEISRVLRKDGFCYFAAGNRLMVREPHHGLPFLSWLPKRLAHGYLRQVTGKTRYEENLYYPWQLRSLLGGFTVEDFTAQIIREPERFSATDVVKPGSLKQTLALRFPFLAYWFCPTYVFVLRKKT